MDRFTNDIRYALRRLAHTPGFTAIAVLSLALGIGANTAIFSMVNAVFFRDAGIASPERVVDVYRSTRNSQYSMVAYRDYEAITEGAPEVLGASSIYVFFTVRLEGATGAEPLMAEIVGGDYLGTFGLTPVLGRGFAPEETTRFGGVAVAMVSERFWRSRLGGSAGAIGQAIRLNGRDYSVIGVMPASFRGKAPGLVPEIWVPLGMRDHINPGIGDSDNMLMSARIREGVTTAQAISAIDILVEELDRERRASTGSNVVLDFAVLPLDEITFFPGLDTVIFAIAALLMTVVGAVLLVACTNLASFLLARAAERRREVAIRLALGANQRALLRQLLTESVLLGVLGGVAGIVVSLVVVRVLLGIRPPVDFTIDLDAGLDLRVLAFTAVISIVAGILFGLAPALRASRANVVQTLRDEAVGVIGGRRRINVRNALVVAQVSLALVLLIGAGLFARSLQRATRVDPGFSTAPGAVVTIEAQPSGYTEEQVPALYEELLRRTEAAPGITRVAIASKLPLAFGVQRMGLTVPEVPPPAGADVHLLDYASVSPAYFEVMGIELFRGRAFTADDDADAPGVALLSAAAAERFWPGQDPIGKVVTRRDGSTLVIVGVAANVKLTRLTDVAVPYVYVPFAQDVSSRMHIVARGNASAAQTVAGVRQAIRQVDENLFISEAKTMAEHMSLILYLPRMAAWLLSVLGALALILAVVGLYGVVSYAVSRRTREVGIRMSLGATSAQVVTMLMRGGLALVLLGAGIGIVLAIASTRLIGGFLIDVGSTDPMTFVLVTLLLASVAALAAYLPARRASGIDPMAALRSE